MLRRGNGAEIGRFTGCGPSEPLYVDIEFRGRCGGRLFIKGKSGIIDTSLVPPGKWRVRSRGLIPGNIPLTESKLILFLAPGGRRWRSADRFGAEGKLIEIETIPFGRPAFGPLLNGNGDVAPRRGPGNRCRLARGAFLPGRL